MLELDSILDVQALLSPLPPESLNIGSPPTDHQVPEHSVPSECPQCFVLSEELSRCLEHLREARRDAWREVQLMRDPRVRQLSAENESLKAELAQVERERLRIVPSLPRSGMLPRVFRTRAYFSLLIPKLSLFLCYKGGYRQITLLAAAGRFPKYRIGYGGYYDPLA